MSDARVTALQTLSDGTVLRLPALALWVAQLPDPAIRIIGGRSDASPTRPRAVSLVKSYV